MQPVIDTADTVLGAIEKIAALIAGLLILVLMALVCAEVLGRGLLNHPVRGSIDMIEQLMVALVTLGVAYCQRVFGNVRMTLVSDRWRGRAKWLSEAFALTIALCVVIVLTRGSWLNLMRSWSNGGDTPEIGIPLWPGIALVTGALALLGLRVLVQLTEALRLCLAPAAPTRIFQDMQDPADTPSHE